MSGELEVREALMRWLETRPEAVVDQAFLKPRSTDELGGLSAP